MSTTVTYKGSTLTTINNQTKTLKTAGKYMEGDVILVDVTETGSGSGVVWQDGQGYIHLSDEGDIELQTKTVTPTETAQTITADAGYYALEKVNVGAISNTYVGTGITRRSSSDLTASGAIVTVPSGYYSAQASKAVANGTQGAPTATKGTVSNHSVSVTPSVTNTTGYIEGGTKTGTAVTVSASELVSGTYNVTSSGTKDVTNYASASVPSGTAGTPTATKGTVSNHSISVTPSVTNTSGYITGSTKTGTAVTVSASELVSGTYSVTSSGTSNVTNYASVSVPSLKLPTTATTPATGTKKGSVRASLNTQYLNIPTGYNDTAQYYEIEPMDVDSKSITENGTYYAYMDGLNGYSSVTVNVSGGGGGSGVSIAYSEAGSNSSSISFSDLEGEPTSFYILYDDSTMSLPSGTPYKIVGVVYDGTDLHGQIATNTNNAQASYSTDLTKSYSNGTLTVTSTNLTFAGIYTIAYTYGGSASDIDTKEVQVGSGATSITFTGLSKQPLYWSCIFKSNFSTSSGYQRVMIVGYNNIRVIGACLDSNVKISNSYWSYSYNNGTLTITSQGTNSGGYFHQPGYYQLTYVYESSEGGGSSYQTKTVTPTTSQQVITADSGYDALSQVTVNAMPTGTAGTPTATKGTVSNHSISVTPSVTNTTGYITGSTKTGTAVTVTASELASGNKAITQNGTGIDVVGYSTVSVNVAGGGGSITPVPQKQINFIDYDGTILYSYSKSEWQSVSALPSNPSHSGLTAQGWNWTKAQINAQLTAMPDGDIWVGQMYITTSGDTEIDITLADSTRLAPYWSCAINGTITIDWGDNSTTTATGTSLTSRRQNQHTYASAGNYTITIHVESGSWAFYGTSTYYSLNKGVGTANANRVYANCIQRVRVGDDVSIGNYAFYNCNSLESITIPKGVTSIGNNAFYSCYSLASVTIPSDVTSIENNTFTSCCSLVNVTIPSGVTSIGNNVFNYCYALPSITIPNGVTSIGSGVFTSCYSLTSVIIPSGVTSIGGTVFNYCYSLASVTIPNGVTSIGISTFGYCYSLASVTIPSDVTSIGNNAFDSCYGMAEYHFKSTTPPTLGTTAFNNIQSDCKIYVPSASLTTYKGATNWSTYASYMQGE